MRPSSAERYLQNVTRRSDEQQEALLLVHCALKTAQRDPAWWSGRSGNEIQGQFLDRRT